MLEIQSKLQEKLRTAEETSAKQEKAIQEAAREQAAAIVADMEEKAAAMESALREREAQHLEFLLRAHLAVAPLRMAWFYLTYLKRSPRHLIARTWRRIRS